MRFRTINYSIRPSFLAPSYCDIGTTVRGPPHSVGIEDQGERRVIQVSADAIVAIINAVTELPPLPIAPDVDGLDGIRYSLSFGLMNTLTYSWWGRLPKEWAALEPLVAAIEAISGFNREGHESHSD